MSAESFLSHIGKHCPLGCDTELLTDFLGDPTCHYVDEAAGQFAVFDADGTQITSFDEVFEWRFEEKKTVYWACCNHGKTTEYSAAEIDDVR